MAAAIAVCLLLFSSRIAYSQRIPGDFPGVREDFNLVVMPQREPQEALTDLRFTDNVVSLKRVNAWTPGSIYAEAMRRNLGIVRATNSSVDLVNVNAGSAFLAPVTVGGQSFDMVVDTGSSDPWLIAPDYVCAAGDTCNFGPPYHNNTSTYQRITNQNFNISYADGERVTGTMGFESFTLGGITIPRQEFAIAEYADWEGDGTSSGLIGFASSSLTSAYPGNNPPDDIGESYKYNTVFDNMYQTQGVPPVFSMAIDRNASAGGIMAYGGIPNIPFSAGFTTVPISNIGVNTSSGQYVYTYYTIPIDGWAFSANQSAQFNTQNITNTTKTPLIGDSEQDGPYPAIVDSGSSLLSVASYVAEDVALAFNPPGYFDYNQQAFVVDCSAIPPLFGPSIAGKIFYVNPADMILEVGPGMCYSGVQSNYGGLTILGDVWMKNVLCVFDVRAQVMRFAAREFYGLGSQGRVVSPVR